MGNASNAEDQVITALHHVYEPSSSADALGHVRHVRHVRHVPITIRISTRISTPHLQLHPRLDSHALQHPLCRTQAIVLIEIAPMPISLATTAHVDMYIRQRLL